MNERLAKEMEAKNKGGTAPEFSAENYRKLVDPYDKTADINLRARSYPQANCAQCHIEAGGGNAFMELEFTTKADMAGKTQRKK